MKILVVQDHLRSGGTERQSVLLTRGFAAAGHAAELVTFRAGGALAESAADLRVRCLQPFPTRLDWWAPGLKRAARAFAPDVILCMGRLANSYGGGLQRACPAAAVVATLRTGKPLPWLFRRSLRQVGHVVANSEQAHARATADHGVTPERISVIHNALVFAPPQTLPARDVGVRERHGAAPGTVVLLCVAMFRPEKNHAALLEIVRHLPAAPDWQLWLAGDGPTRPAVEAAVQAAGLGARIKFLGWHADPTPLYRAADVAVLTSRRESLSNFLIEAQAHGLPTVAYNAMGVGEAFVDGESGLLVPMDQPDAFRTALALLLPDAPRRRAMAECALRHVHRRFAPATQIQAYLTLFARLTASRVP